MYSGSSSSSPLPVVSGPIPLATYMPTLHQSAFHGGEYQPVAGPSPLFRHPSTSSTSSRYDAYQAPVLSTSSLEQGTVYRGVFHGAEPTAFAQPNLHQNQLWNQHSHHDAFNHSAAKKLELGQKELAYPIAYSTVAYGAPAAIAAIDLPAVPSHVERFTSFYSASVPAVILKALRIGFQSLSEMRVDFVEEASKGKFRGQAFTEDNESIQFIARVYKAGHGAPAPYLVEFQRRCGDSVSFFRLFQKMLKSCSSIHHGPYEASFAVAGMSLAPIQAASPAAFPHAALSLPNMQAMRLDLPSVTSLCSMMSADCIESKRESTKVLANLALSADLFPPTLERQTSSPSALAAAKAIWSAVDSVLASGDDECTRLGCSLLRNCLSKGDAPMLLEQLEMEPSTVAHLVAKLNHPSESLQSREVKRQVAAVLNQLQAKNGAHWMNRVAPGAQQTLAAYQHQL